MKLGPTPGQPRPVLALFIRWAPYAGRGNTFMWSVRGRVPYR